MPKSKKNKNLDTVVLQLFNEVKQRKLAISALEKPSWVTSCTIGTNPNTLEGRINIQTVTDVAVLVDMYGFLLQKFDYAASATEELGLSPTIGSQFTFKWMGFTLEQWKADFKTRLASISLKNKRAELNILEARLNTLITPEQRRELELEEIQNQMRSLNEI